MSNATQRTKQANMFGTIDDLLRQLDTTKTASTLSEPGSIGGETSHPVKDVDDRLQKATEGSRSSENSEDAKDANPTAGVDSTSPGTPGGQDSVQSDIGLTSKATGEDAANETDKAKGGKEDPGSGHPARTDNDELDGSKYSSQYDFLDALCKKAAADGNDLLAAITVESDNIKKAGQGKPGAKPVAKTASEVQPDPTDAEPELDKNAVDGMVISSLAETIAESEARAEKTAEYLATYFTVRQKRAEEEAVEPEAVPPEAGGGEMGGGAPAGPEAGGGGEEALMAQLGGGAGGEMGGASGGDAGGGQPSPEDLQMIAQILQETGMTPDDLIELIAGGAGGGGAPGPEAGGMPPPPPGPAAPPGPPAPPMGGGGPDPMAGKIAAAQLKQKLWGAKTAADRAKYAKVKSHLMELLSANKR